MSTWCSNQLSYAPDCYTAAPSEQQIQRAGTLTATAKAVNYAKWSRIRARAKSSRFCTLAHCLLGGSLTRGFASRLDALFLSGIDRVILALALTCPNPATFPQSAMPSAPSSCTVALVALWLTVPNAELASAAPRIEFFEGPINSSQRVVGLGGAFTSVGEGAEAHLVNPASFGVRTAFSRTSWYDWDFGLSAFSVIGKQIDIDQSGNRARVDSAQLAQAGFNLKFGRFATGLHVRSQNLTLAVNDVITQRQIPYSFEHTFGGYGFAWSFARGEWVAGAVLSIGTATLAFGGSQPGSVKFQSAAGFHSLGLLHAPHGERWRAGLALQTGLDLRAVDALGQAIVPAGKVGLLDTPELIHTPWQASMGMSYMTGARPFNLPTAVAADLPQGPTGTQIPRHYTLFSADVVVNGPTGNAISAASYLAQQPLKAGQTGTISVRGGVESEIWANRLAVRLGSYYEPSRYAGAWGRGHLTGGFDVRLTLIWDWKISYCFDFARGYNNSALGLGFWH